MPENTERIERLERRMIALESDISALHSALESLAPARNVPSVPSAPSTSPEPVIHAPAPPPYPAEPEPPASPDAPNQTGHPSADSFADSFSRQFGSSEFWINKVGIGLLLLGVIFLFKYSIGQGWITPAIRVMTGLALGLALTITGLRIYSRKRHHALVALGGAVATFYICSFAMYQMYDLTPYAVAFLLMLTASALAIVFSIKQDEPILSFVAALGAYAVPFLLYSGEGNVPRLILYTSLITVMTCAVYFARGWVSLITLSAICSWLILYISADNSLHTQTERLALQAGVTLSWLLFWGAPVLRLALLSKSDVPLWLKSSPDGRDILAPGGNASIPGHAHTLTITTPVIAFGLSILTWKLADNQWSLIAIAVAVVYFTVWWTLRKRETLAELASTQMIAGFLMLSVAAIELLNDTTTPAFLAAQALALRVVSRRVTVNSVKKWSLVYLIGALGWITMETMFGSLFSSSAVTALSAETLVALWVALVTFAFVYFTDDKDERVGLTVVGAIVLGYACLRVMDSAGLFLVVTLVAVATVAAGQITRKESLYLAGSAMYLPLAVWLFSRLFDLEQTGTPFLNMQAAVETLAVLSGFALSRFVTQHRFAVAFGLVAHVALLALVFREFIGLENGHGIITSVWGVYTIGIIVMSLRMRDIRLKKVATATLALVIGKLFFVDLGNLESLWRILLFIGLGAVLMAVSYFYQRIWNSAKAPDKSTESSEHSGN